MKAMLVKKNSGRVVVDTELMIWDVIDSDGRYFIVQAGYLPGMFALYSDSDHIGYVSPSAEGTTFGEYVVRDSRWGIEG